MTRPSRRVAVSVLVATAVCALSTVGGGPTGHTGTSKIAAAPHLADGEQCYAEGPAQQAPWYLSTPLIPDLSLLEQTTGGGSGVKVAVIDTGVSTNNPQLRVHGGADFIKSSDRDGTIDTDGHGTGVAGVIAAQPTGHSGVVGIAPHADIYSYRENTGQTRPGSGAGGIVNTPDGLAAAIHQAVDDGADIINISQVGPDSTALESALQYAASHNRLVVVSAGNDAQNGNPTEYPAADSTNSSLTVLAVGSVGPTLSPSAFSERRPYVDVAAPGQLIDALLPNNNSDAGYSDGQAPDYCTDQQGTSFSAPYVSGVAALMISLTHHGLSAHQLIHIIEASASRSGSTWNSAVGYGVINPYAAVVDAKDDPNATPPAPNSGQHETGSGAVSALPRLPAKANSTERVQRVGAYVAAGIVGLLGLSTLLGVFVLRDYRRRRRGLLRGPRDGGDARQVAKLSPDGVLSPIDDQAPAVELIPSPGRSEG